MSEISQQRAAMEAVTEYLSAVKEYVDDVANDVPEFQTFIENLELSDIEAYLLNKMSFTPSFIESAVQEVYIFISSWYRDNVVRRMSRADYFTDASSSLMNDIDYLVSLKELQTSFISGEHPQQRS